MSTLTTRRPKPQKHADKACAERYRVIRWDGTVMGGSPDKATAERMCRVICTGQRADYAFVTGGAR